MKKTLIKISLIMFLAATFFACGSGGGSPEEVVKSYLKAINNQNWNAAKKLSTESTHEFIDFMENASKMAQMTGQKPEKKAGKIEDLDCTEKEDTCECTLLLDGDFERIKLVKVNGKWLVEQSKEMPGFGWD